MTPLPQIWTTDVFGNLTAAIRAEHQKHARIRPLIPAAPPEPGAYGVVVPVVTANTQPSRFIGSPSMDKDIVQPTRMTVEFRVNSNELEDVEFATTIARRAGRALAHAEDAVLAFGQMIGPASSRTNPRQVGPVRIVRVASADGLFGHEGNTESSADKADGHLFIANAQGANAHLADGSPPVLGPYVCVTARAGEKDGRDLVGDKQLARDIAARHSEISDYGYVPHDLTDSSRGFRIDELTREVDTLKHTVKNLEQKAARHGSEVGRLKTQKDELEAELNGGADGDDDGDKNGKNKNAETLSNLKRVSDELKQEQSGAENTDDERKSAKRELGDVTSRLDALKQHPTPYLCMFPQDATYLDFVEVLPPTCSFRGFDHASGAAIMLIESSFVLRIKDDSGIARIWI